MSAVDDEVRRRLQQRLASGGVRQREVAFEVMWWLPREFVEAYERLFLRALSLGDEGVNPGGDGVDEGRIVAKVKAGLRGKAGSMAAQGGGKRYKTEWIVKDERALEVKARVDRRLRRLVDGVWDQVLKESRGSTPGETHGSRGGSGGEGIELREMGKGKVRKVCRECGKMMRDDFVRCPYLHA
jgi:hypothetical protein